MMNISVQIQDKQAPTIIMFDLLTFIELKLWRKKSLFYLHNTYT